MKAFVVHPGLTTRRPTELSHRATTTVRRSHPRPSPSRRRPAGIATRSAPRADMAPTVPRSISESDLVDVLTPLYRADRGKVLRAVAAVKTANRTTRPLFPDGVDVRAVPRVPADEVDAFVSEHISDVYVSWDHPSRPGRMANNGRPAQFARWNWVLSNMETYVNMLRVKGFEDDRIIEMMGGMPLCMPSREAFDELRGALARLAPAIEEEKGWRNVGFVFTGSSVPGFSQNPLKGFPNRPGRITNATSSDVDICIVGDGINLTVSKLIGRDAMAMEPKRAYPTTINEISSGLRYGCTDLVHFCKAAAVFYDEWSVKLPGGLQFTFCEDDTDIPPWEAYIDTNVA